MKNAKKYGLSEFQLSALVFSAMVGSGVMTMPRTVGAEAGRDGWLSILLAGVLIWLVSGLVYLLCSRFPTKTLAQFSVTILGRPLGFLVSVAYSLYALAVAATALRIFAELTKNWVMVWTPMWIGFFGVLFPVVYVARMGGITLARLTELVLYMTIPAMLLFLLPIDQFNHLNLLPVGAEGGIAIIKGVPASAFAHIGFEILLVFFPLVIDRKRIFRAYFLGLGLVTLLYIVNAILIYGVLGIEHTLVQVWPLMNYLRIGILPVAERVDNAVLFIWTAQVFTVVAIHYYSASITLATLAGHTRHDTWASLLWVVVFAAATLPNRLVEVFAWADLVGQWGIIYVTGIVVVMYGVAVLRGLNEGREPTKGG